MGLSHEYIVLRDKDEKRPLKFPRHVMVSNPYSAQSRSKGLNVRLTVKQANLSTGDYAIEGHEGKVLVERKGGIREVAKNCLTSDHRRFKRQLERLRDECERPFLFLEGSPASLSRHEDSEVNAELAMSHLISMVYDHGVNLLVFPCKTDRQKMQAGRFIAQLLIQGSLR